MTYHLAIDIGASSGRHILGYIDNGRLKLEEIHRFENYITNQNGTLVWDIEHLVSEVKKGIAKCKEIGKIPCTVAIDTWGVDYVLLDESKQEILPAVSYRDSRTNRVINKVESIISAEELYLKTGIQKQNFNTIYQLYVDYLSGKLDNAKYFLMIPAYLSYKLTGVIKNEYTNATTTGMVNADTKQWDDEIIEKLSLPKHLFGTLDTPCTVIGNFTKEMQDYAGFDSTVIFAPSHDTASAVCACPIDDNSVYISSGTWSLIGVESLNPIVNEKSMAANFANEGGIDYRFRFLKNYMGMWLFQNVKKNLNNEFSYDDMMRLAMQSKRFEMIDTNSPSFLAPENMIIAIRSYLKNESIPIEVVINSVYHSLAQSYKNAIDEIEKLAGKTIDNIFIVGGGSKDTYLNELTAQYTGKKVVTGLSEATATGNLLSQIMFDKKISLAQSRELVRNSFDIKEIN
ncbi:rhamnulokinase family protein [uncultured Eubacterium sp.]|uniref:rhamnulokinase n=1 Tax=uncultured Eubacterium sp. TaxID=165185 RepID=UPI0025839B6F|nr:rhamnulokinase family protein [uncultured Eubacterium sp.]